jgi:hypothetical protein
MDGLLVANLLEVLVYHNPPENIEEIDAKHYNNPTKL